MKFASLAKRSLEPGFSSNASQRYGSSCEPKELNQAVSRVLADQPWSIRISAGLLGPGGLGVGASAPRWQLTVNVTLAISKADSAGSPFLVMRFPRRRPTISQRQPLWQAQRDRGQMRKTNRR